MKIKEYERRFVQTDLACESGRISPSDCEGCRYSRKDYGNVTVERLDILNDEGKRALEREIGSYVTVSGDAVRKDVGQDTVLSGILEKEIKKLSEKTLSQKITKQTKVLIAGIGNELISSDSLGPVTAGMISPTRHLAEVPAFKSFGFCEVSVIKTAVLGQTGIESSEIIKSVCDKIHPDIVVAIDALAARSSSRLASTVQISDIGISPGGGINNNRPTIGKENLGIPVISIGVPTVVNSSTLIFDALYDSGIRELDDKMVEKLENSKKFFVTTKDCDLVSRRLSCVISAALNGVFGYGTL